MHRQLTLNLLINEEAKFENFITHDKSIIYCIKQYIENKEEHFAFIHGSQACGVSFILQAICNYMILKGKSAFYFSLKDTTVLTDVLQNMENMDLVCIDDIEQAMHTEWEEHILHFYNRSREKNKKLIISAHHPQNKLTCSFKELSSRLHWGLTVTLPNVDNETKLEILKKQAFLRGLILSKSVEQFILKMCNYHLGEISNLLTKLEQASLAHKRRITIPFIKMIQKTTT